MLITHLEFQNFKGRDFSGDIAPVTAVVGNNFARKTSLPMAIRLALRGSLPPPIGTKGIYSLAGNPDAQGEMSIRLVLDGTREITHTWTKNAKGSVKYVGAIPPDMQMPELLMEPKLFFGKTAAERTNIIFGCCQAIEFDRDSIVVAMNDVNEGFGEVCEAVKKEVTAYIDAFPQETTPQDLCARLVDWLKVKQKAASDDLKRAQGALAAFQGTVTERVSDHSKALAEARTKLAQMNIPNDANAMKEELARLRDTSELPALQKKILELQAAAVPMEEDPEEELNQAQRALNETTRQLLDVNAHLGRLEGSLAETKKQKECPYCKSSHKGWAKAVTETFEKQIADTKTRITDLRKVEAKESETVKSLAAIVANAKNLHECRVLRDTLQTIAVRRTELELSIASSQPDKQGNDRAELQALIADLEEKQRKWDQFQTDKKRRDKHDAEAVAKSTTESTLKAIVKVVSGIQDGLIDEAFGSVLKTANHCIGGLLHSPLQFRNGELGRFVSQADITLGCKAPVGSWISHECFSGTEELLSYAGFAVALCQDAPIKIVILDELGRVDDLRKLNLVNHMITLIRAEVIDQVVLVDVNSDMWGTINAPEFKLLKL